MTYAELLHTIPAGLKTAYRKFENVSKKLQNIHWSMEFNSICLKENILPNFSKIKHHDPALPITDATHKYRRHLVLHEMKNKEKQKTTLEHERNQHLSYIEDFNCNSELKDSVWKELNVILANSNVICKTRITKKLNSLYQGREVDPRNKYFCIKKEVDSFINLSDYNLSPEEKEFLNLGLNCHLQPKYDKIHKQVELEILYQNLVQLEARNVISLKPELTDQLRSEGTKHRNPKYTSVLTPSLRNAAKSLKNNNDIMIRKADKSSTYVIMNKQEYIDKLNDILSDESKFKQIKANPVETLKKKANELIETLNSLQDDIKLPKIIGGFKPGYIYGNVKIHKPNNPLRPIISQIPTPTYNLAKTLNKIISPYVPTQYSLRSSSDFIDSLNSNKCRGTIASLDVESLFTNVPIEQTIEIIIELAYSDPNLPSPKIPREILRKLLQLCTKEAPFRSPDGKLYVQIEGVAMGSPLGPSFANFYMGYLESLAFADPENKPFIYARYMDDTFVQIKDESQLIKLRELFQNNSILKFTYEMNVNKKLPFLDVLVDCSSDKFKTQVYHKPTDQGFCLNADGECVEKYKISVITNYLNRAFKVCSNWSDFHTEVQCIKQRLVNNNYSNKMIDTQISKFLEQKLKLTEQKEKKNPILVFYESQTHSNYKIEERTIQSIVHNNIKCLKDDDELRITFYYKNNKTSNLVMKNNLGPPVRQLEKTNVIYKFKCPMSHGQATEYIGFSQSTLSQRLTFHRQNGSIRDHFEMYHNQKPTREQLTDNTEVIARAKDRHRLAIKEALLILKERPIINKQFDNFGNVLKLYSNRNPLSTRLAQPKIDKPIPPETQVLPPPAPLSITPNPDQVHPNLVPNPELTPNPDTTVDLDLAPLLPISPRTMHLMTSPIKVNMLTQHYNDRYTPSKTSNVQKTLFPEKQTPTIDPTTETPVSMPNMETVLKKFGINLDNLKEVNIQYYHWNTVDPELSISQRIRSLVRHTKIKSKIAPQTSSERNY